MKLRILLFFVTLLMALVGPFWVFLPLLALYILCYAGMEALCIALLVDAYFGFGTTYPGLYTVITGVCILLVHTLRPALFVYRR